MIFVIPIVLGAAALATAAFGAVKGAEGMGKMNEAKEIGDRVKERHDRAVSQLKVEFEEVNRLAEVYGQLQIRVKQRTIGRFVAFIERIGQKASQSDMKILKELNITVQQIQEYKATALEAEQFAKGGAQAAIAGVAASQGTVALATSVGVASTGTAISGLSGAAAWNATLAWLGGGSLAAGGGGMALGTLVLGGITVGPALAVGGFVLAGQGEKAVTNAREYEANANIKIAKIEAAGDFLQRVERRIEEQGKLAHRLESLAATALNELESRPFNRDRDAAKFQQVALLVTAVAEIVKTPVLDGHGNLNPAVVTLQAKYKNL